MVCIGFSALFFLAGCLQEEKILKLNADGSGTIEERVVRSKEMAAFYQQMSAQSQGVISTPDIFNESRFKAAATEIGHGVTFVSAKNLKGEKGDGFAVVYAFSDINKVKLDPNPGDLMSADSSAKIGQDKEFITFRFTKGKPSELHVSLPSADKKSKDIDLSKQADDQLIQALREGMKDMRSSLRIEVAGAIRETNAEYHGNSWVTLSEMDMKKITANPERFKALIKAGPLSPRSTKAMLPGVDGVEIEIAPEVTIKFQ